ncbi:MAG: transporter [Thermoleophilia bacterium]|nr:transporter [Thermoleophilia bacterium]MCZ4496867.1 transporter [Thermoleophilia bacterium]
MESSQLAIDARGLVKHYRRGVRAGLRRSTAVDGLDLQVARGTVHGLLGPNGAGKTTTIHMLLGLVRPSAGSVDVLGGSIRDAAIRAQVGYVPEKFELPPFLTARGFLELHARLQGRVARSERAREIERVLERVSLRSRSEDPISTLSKGMQQRLAIAQAILGTPQLVILDEPTSALDPVGRRDVRDLVLDLRRQGVAVLLNSHLLSEVEQVCDDVAIIEHGRVVREHALEPQQDSALQLRLRVRDCSPAIAAHVTRIAPGVVITGQEPGDIAELAGRVASEDDVAAIAAAVIGGGGRLLRLTTDTESLEDLFLRVVGDDTSEATS